MDKAGKMGYNWDLWGYAPTGSEREALHLYMRQVEQALVQCLDNIMWLLDPDEIIFDSEYDRLLPGFFDQLSAAYLKRAEEERGEYIPRLSRFQAGESALYKGARNAVRELFFQSLA